MLALCLMTMICASGCRTQTSRLPCVQIPEPEPGMTQEWDAVKECCPSTALWMRRVKRADEKARGDAE